MFSYTSLTVILLDVGLAIAADWSYSGDEGPNQWADIEGSFCGDSKQSPIDIITADAMSKDLGDFVFNGYSLNDDDAGVPSIIENNGHSLTVHLEGNYVLSGGGLPGKYKAVQFHFHWGNKTGRGSEHKLDGQSYDAEMHVVHYNSDTYDNFEAAVGENDEESLAVLGVFLEIGEEDNEAFNNVFNLAEAVSYGGEVMSLENDTFSVAELLPKDLSTYYRYSGSLTTPKCNEIVIWTLFGEIVTISQAQIAALRGLHEDSDGEQPYIGDNYRPIQALNDRVVYCNGGQSNFTPAVALLAVMVIHLMQYILY